LMALFEIAGGCGAIRSEELRVQRTLDILWVLISSTSTSARPVHRPLPEGRKAGARNGFR
jgi:hypothetical protein